MMNKSTQFVPDKELAKEKQLRAELARLQSVIKQLPCTIWTTDSSLKLTASMGMLAKSLGLNGRQTTGITLGQFFRSAQPDFHTIAAHIVHLSALHGKPGTFELDWLGRNLLCYVEPLRGKGKTIEGVIGVGFDITELKQTDIALRATERKLDLIFASVAEGISVTDLSGTIIEVNNRVLEMHAYQDKSELIGKDTSILVAKGDQKNFLGRLRETLEEGVVRDAEYSFVRKDGTTFPASLTASVLRDASGKPIGVITVSRDITEKRQTEKEITSYQERLREASFKLALAAEFERRRIAQAVHDSMGTGLTMLNIKLGELIESVPAELYEDLAQTRQSVNQLAQEARSLAFDLSSPILYELGLKEALDYLADDYTAKYDINCTFRADDTDYDISNDVAVLAYQAVRELMTNVLKHSGAKNASISLKRHENCLNIKAASRNWWKFDLAISYTLLPS